MARSGWFRWWTACGLLWASAALAQAQPGAPAVEFVAPRVVLELSTGDRIEGEVLGRRGDRWRVKTAEGLAAVVPKNLIRVRFADDTEAVLRFALQRRMPALAECAALAVLTGTAMDGEQAGWTRLDLWRLDDVRRGEAGPPGQAQTHAALRAVYAEFRTATPSWLAEQGQAEARATRRGRGSSSAEPLERRYPVASPRQVRNAMRAEREAAEVLEGIEPGMRRIETDHFVIYTALPKSIDKLLVKASDHLYDRFADLFSLEDGENLWVAKLPIFATSGEQPFIRFSAEAFDIPRGQSGQAAGYYLTRGDFRCVVLGEVALPWFRTPEETRRWLVEVLIHETSHAFIGRFISPRRLPSWLDEGVAELNAKELMDKPRQTVSDRRRRQAEQELARHGPSWFRPIFDARAIIGGRGETYGAAHSVVHLLYRSDRQRFVGLVERIKNGEDHAEALQAEYGMTYDQLAQQWADSLR